VPQFDTVRPVTPTNTKQPLNNGPVEVLLSLSESNNALAQHGEQNANFKNGLKYSMNYAYLLRLFGAKTERRLQIYVCIGKHVWYHETNKPEMCCETSVEKPASQRTYGFLT
jgi:hypothetical protein